MNWVLFFIMSLDENVIIDFQLIALYITITLPNQYCIAMLQTIRF